MRHFELLRGVVFWVAFAVLVPSAESRLSMLALTSDPTTNVPPLPASALFPHTPLISLAVTPKVFPRAGLKELKLSAFPRSSIPAHITAIQGHSNFVWTDSDVTNITAQWYGVGAAGSGGGPVVGPMDIDAMETKPVPKRANHSTPSDTFDGVLAVHSGTGDAVALVADLWLTYSSPELRRPISYGIPASSDSVFFPAGLGDTRPGMSNNAIPADDETGINAAVTSVSWKFYGWAAAAGAASAGSTRHDFVYTGTKLTEVVSGDMFRSGFVYMAECTAIITAGIGSDYSVFNYKNGSAWLAKTKGAQSVWPQAQTGTASFSGSSVRAAYFLVTGYYNVNMLTSATNGTAFQTRFAMNSFIVGDSVTLGLGATSVATPAAARAAYLGASFFSTPAVQKAFAVAVTTSAVSVPTGAVLCPLTINWTPQWYKTLYYVVSVFGFEPSDLTICPFSTSAAVALDISTSTASAPAVVFYYSYRMLLGNASQLANLKYNYFDKVDMSSWPGTILTSFSTDNAFSGMFPAGTDADHTVNVIVIARSPDQHYVWSSVALTVVPRQSITVTVANTTTGILNALNDTMAVVDIVTNATADGMAPTQLFFGPLQDAVAVVGVLTDKTIIDGIPTNASSSTALSNARVKLMDVISGSFTAFTPTASETVVPASNVLLASASDLLANLSKQMRTQANATSAHDVDVNATLALAASLPSVLQQAVPANMPIEDDGLTFPPFPTAIGETAVGVLRDMLYIVSIGPNTSFTSSDQTAISESISASTTALASAALRNTSVPSTTPDSATTSAPIHFGLEAACDIAARNESAAELSSMIVLSTARMRLSSTSAQRSGGFPAPNCNSTRFPNASDLLQLPSVSVPMDTALESAQRTVNGRRLAIASDTQAPLTPSTVDIVVASLPAGPAFNTTQWSPLFTNYTTVAAALATVGDSEAAKAAASLAEPPTPVEIALLAALGPLNSSVPLGINNGLESPVVMVQLQSKGARQFIVAGASEPITINIPITNPSGPVDLPSDVGSVTLNCPSEADMMLYTNYRPNSPWGNFSIPVNFTRVVNATFREPRIRPHSSLSLLPFSGESAAAQLLKDPSFYKRYVSPVLDEDYIETVTRPVLVLTADCGFGGKQLISCGPGYYNTTFVFQCPTPSVLPSCIYYDKASSTWTDTGCYPSANAAGGFDCNCNHLTNFGARFTAVGVVSRQMFAQSPKLTGIKVYAWYPYVVAVLAALVLSFLCCCGMGAALDTVGDRYFYDILDEDREVRLIKVLDVACGETFVLDRLLDNKLIPKSKFAAVPISAVMNELLGLASPEHSLEKQYMDTAPSARRKPPPADIDDEFPNSNPEPELPTMVDHGPPLFSSLEQAYKDHGVTRAFAEGSSLKHGLKASLADMRQITAHPSFTSMLLAREIAWELVSDATVKQTAAAIMAGGDAANGNLGTVREEDGSEEEEDEAELARTAEIEAETAAATAANAARLNKLNLVLPPIAVPPVKASPRTAVSKAIDHALSPDFIQTRREMTSTSAKLTARYAKDDLVAYAGYGKNSIDLNKTNTPVARKKAFLSFSGPDCCRNGCCGYTDPWFVFKMCRARLSLHHTYIGWLFSYNPWLRRPQRVLIMACVLLGNLTIAALLYGYRSGQRAGELPPLELSEAAVIALISALLQVPVEATSRYLMGLAGLSEFQWRYPGLWDEISQRRAAQARLSKLSTEALEAEVLLSPPLEFRGAGHGRNATHDVVRQAELALIPTTLVMRAATSGILVSQPTAGAPTHLPPSLALSARIFSRRDLKHQQHHHNIEAAEFDYGWRDAPSCCVKSCGFFVRMCGRHPSQKHEYIRKRKLAEARRIALAALSRQKEVIGMNKNRSGLRMKTLALLAAKNESANAATSRSTTRSMRAGQPGSFAGLSADDLGAQYVEESGEDHEEAWVSSIDWNNLTVVEDEDEPSKKRCALKQLPTVRMTADTPIEELLGESAAIAKEAKMKAVRGFVCLGCICTRRMAWTHSILIVWIAFCVYYMLLFGIFQPGDALQSYLLAWAASQGVALLITQPILTMIHVLWWFVFVPSLARGTTWLPSVQKWVVGNLVRSKWMRDGSQCLTARLETLTLVQAAGIASGLSPNAAAVAFAGSAALTAALATVGAAVGLPILSGAGNGLFSTPSAQALDAVPETPLERRRRDLITRRYLLIRLKARMAAVAARLAATPPEPNSPAVMLSLPSIRIKSQRGLDDLEKKPLTPRVTEAKINPGDGPIQKIVIPALHSKHTMKPSDVAPLPSKTSSSGNPASMRSSSSKATFASSDKHLHGKSAISPNNRAGQSVHAPISADPIAERDQDDDDDDEESVYEHPSSPMVSRKSEASKAQEDPRSATHSHAEHHHHQHTRTRSSDIADSHESKHVPRKHAEDRPHTISPSHASRHHPAEHTEEPSPKHSVEQHMDARSREAAKYFAARRAALTAELPAASGPVHTYDSYESGSVVSEHSSKHRHHHSRDYEDSPKNNHHETRASEAAKYRTASALSPAHKSTYHHGGDAAVAEPSPKTHHTDARAKYFADRNADVASAVSPSHGRRDSRLTATPSPKLPELRPAAGAGVVTSPGKDKEKRTSVVASMTFIDDIQF
jgi:hypothetical protein